MNNFQQDIYKADILIIDDTPANLRLLIDILTTQGYKVRPAHNGRIALNAAQTKPPDLILLDIKMLGMSGYEVCEKLKADKQTRDVPIIFISATDNVDDKIKAFSIGGVDFIIKPIQPLELLSRVETHLTIQNMRKRLELKNIQLQQQIAEKEQTEDDLQQAYDELEQRVDELSTLNHIIQAVTMAADLQTALQIIAQTMTQLFNCFGCTIAMFNLSKSEATVVSEYTQISLDNIPSMLGFIIPVKDSQFFAQVIETRQPIIISIPKLQTNPSTKPIHDIMQARGVHNIMIIPLFARGNILGIIGLETDKIDHIFTATDIALAETIAGHIGGSIDNARLLEKEQKAKESAEAANAALSALNAVTIAVNSSLDLEANFEKSLKIVLNSLNLEQAWLLMPEYNNKMLRLIAAIGFPDEFLKKEALTPIDRCACGDIIKSGELQCHFEEGVCLRLAEYMEQYPTLSTKHISLPIFTRQKVVAILNMGGKNVTNLTDRDYEWLKAVAQQIGNAIENSTLYHNTLDKADRLRVINRVSTIISLSWKLDRVLPPLLREMACVLEMSLGLIVLRSGKNKHKYKTRTKFGHWQTEAELDNIKWSKLPFLETIEQTRAPMLIPNPANDQRLEQLSELVDKENIKTMLILPLVVRDKLVGFILLNAVVWKRAFEAAGIELARTLTNQAAMAIEKALLYEETVTHYEEELDIARQIQQNLLPRSAPEIPGMRIAGYCQPARATGGDFYDYIILPNNCFGIVVGDVTGKSLPAAMVMALARNTVRSELVNHLMPDKAMTAANWWLCQDIRRGTFVATVEALIDYSNKVMWLVNAGQTATIMMRDNQVSYLLPDEAAGFPLGIQPELVYSQAKINLQSGDTLLFYTDGIVEAKNATTEMFGFERFEEAIKVNINLNGNDPDSFIHNIIAYMQDFVGEAEQHDDITLVVVQLE